ncbi:MAG TPA: hypothetical protein VN920_07775 [Pyrinomonadaceae bacterium]|nr:hypothetical protein [Pyrinomonadaceae bacterium]
MKKIIMFLSVCATVALLALPAFATRTERQPVQPQEPCSFDSKSALYKEFLANYKGDTPKANEAAKKYVACPVDQTLEKEVKEAEDKRVVFLNTWIGKYEKENRKTRLQLALNGKKYDEAFPIGKDILNDEPENLRIILDLTNAGYAANSASLDADTIAYAKKSIQLIEAGKAPEKWAPFESKDDALGWLNYIIATRVAKNSPAEAIPYFIKAASYDGKIKKLPITYAALGEAYEKGPHAKLSADYKSKFEGKDETPESKLALENINQVVDRMIDAYARAVALAGTDPQYAEIKTKSLDAATFYYKSRHDKSDKGLNEMIASVLSKPLPPEPTPLTSLPTPAATPASAPGTSASGAAPTGNGASPAKTTAASSPAKAPTKPKMRQKAHAQR